MQQSRKMARGHLRPRRLGVAVGGRREARSAPCDTVHGDVAASHTQRGQVFKNCAFKVTLFSPHPPVTPFLRSSHVMIGNSVQEKHQNTVLTVSYAGKG